MSQKEHIQSIKDRYIKSDKEFVLGSLNRGIDRLQKAFPRYGSFLMEFIQNADDAKSGSIRIEILQDVIRICNDGCLFSEKDVDSICKVGWSSKTSKDYIGYLGVGFKAVFLISECTEIYSGDYWFKFDKNYWPDPNHIPWQIIPLWIDNPNIKFSEKHKTIFNLPIKESGLVQKLEEEVRPENLSDRILLFLRNIKEVEIVNSVQNLNRKIIKSESCKTEDYEIYEIIDYENDSLKKKECWLVFRSICNVPEKVKEDYITKEWEREKVEKREVLVAFKLDVDSNLVIEEKGTAHIGVFSFLPLKEIPSGLNFLLQADFLTTPGRGELARECLWNEWLADEVYNLIVKKCIPIFLNHEKWKLFFTQILYSALGGHELFEIHIKKPLREYLENNPSLVVIDGSIVKPDEAILIETDIEELINQKDLETLYPHKKILHHKCVIPWEIRIKVKEGPTFSSSKGISPEMEHLLNLKEQQKNIEFFKKFFLKISRCSESTLRSSPLRYQNIIPTYEWGLADSRIVYIKSKNLTIPKEVEKNFKIVNTDLTSEPDILSLLKGLGVSELTEEHIQNILKTKEIPKMAKDWVALTEEEKISNVKFCKELWGKSQITAKDLPFLTLKTKSGKWSKSEDLVFSMEYKPDHIIESLVNDKKLLDFQLEFVSSDFIKDEKDDKIRGWVRFFKKLGVDKKLEQEQNRITQRIGVLTALQFEKAKGRMARELGESEKLGYDIESKSETEERCIEVKSSSHSYPNIFITTNELKTLQAKQSEYFVYVVRETLRNPTLSVTRGNRLLDISDVRTIIPFSKWWGTAKEEEYRP